LLLPSIGDHFNNQIAFGPKDGKLYFGQGNTTTNSLDVNASFTTVPATLKEQSFVACGILAPNVSCLS